MSYASDIAKLTSDPGARALGHLMDIMAAKVDACCGGDDDVTKAAAKQPDAKGEAKVDGNK